MEILTTSELTAVTKRYGWTQQEGLINFCVCLPLGLHPGSFQKTTPTSPLKGHKLGALLNVANFHFYKCFIVIGWSHFTKQNSINITPFEFLSISRYSARQT